MHLVSYVNVNPFWDRIDGLRVRQNNPLRGTDAGALPASPPARCASTSFMAATMRALRCARLGDGFDISRILTGTIAMGVDSSGGVLLQLGESPAPGRWLSGSAIAMAASLARAARLHVTRRWRCSSAVPRPTPAHLPAGGPWGWAQVSTAAILAPHWPALACTRWHQ